VNESIIQRAAVLATLRGNKRALHVAELRGQLGLDKSQQQALFLELERMVEDGLLSQLPGGRFRFKSARPRLSDDPSAQPAEASAKPASSAGGQRSRSGGDGRRATHIRGGHAAENERLGRITLNAKGYGFVLTDEQGPDVFIPPGALHGAMHGDRVRVQTQRSPKGLDGRVLEVLERAVRHVSGELHLAPTGAWLDPDDDRLQVPVYVVGELPKSARTGQAAIARVVRYPEPREPFIEVELEETFDDDQLVNYELRRTLMREGVVTEFPAAALAEAAAFPPEPSAHDRVGREDLRHLDLLTIDPPDARDHDDAVYAERRPDGGFRLVVAIADVSHYVREGSALDAEAMARGCTVYLPTHAIPMLPKELSKELASLVPRQDRLALAVDMEIGAQGAVKSYRFIEALMRSPALLTYDQVARELGLTERGERSPEAARFLPLLQTLLDVAEVLGKHRKRRGSLGFDLPEPKVKLDPATGKPVSVEQSRSDPGLARAYNLIEETALLANEVVAQDLTQRGVPALYRVHGAPDPEKVEAFAALAESVGLPLKPEDAQNPKELSKFLARIEGTPHARSLGYLLLRAMQQATYSTENIGHFGLAAKDYVHFTSPIRRYPDLVVHRLVKRIARGERIRGDELQASLQAIAVESSRLERRAMTVEREIVDLYRALLMRDHIGEEYSAVITGITEYGFFCTLESPFVDVMCRTQALSDDFWEMDQYGLRLTGQRSGLIFSLGDRLQVRIEDVSVVRRRISAVPIAVEGALRIAASRGRGGPGARPDGRRPAKPRDERQVPGSSRGGGGGGGGGGRQAPSKARDSRGQRDASGRKGAGKGPAKGPATGKAAAKRKGGGKGKRR
jgi:ribonuclease R